LSATVGVDARNRIAEEPDAVLATARQASRRWFARLISSSIAILGLAAFWIASGVVALGPGHAAALEHFTQAGFAPTTARLALTSARCSTLQWAWPCACGATRRPAGHAGDGSRLSLVGTVGAPVDRSAGAIR
jgi:hypothetical protein